MCDLLGQLTDYGCRVIVFLDGVHNVGEPLVSEIKPLVRELYQKRRVITFVASKEGPSDVDVPNEHGLFALGLLQVFQGTSPGGPDGNRSNGYTLDQFKTALRDAVQNLSGRQQDASCYIPLELAGTDLVRQAVKRPYEQPRCRVGKAGRRRIAGSPKRHDIERCLRGLKSRGPVRPGDGTGVPGLLAVASALPSVDVKNAREPR